MRLLRRRMIASLSFAALSVSPWISSAQRTPTFPMRAVTIVVPYPAGGPYDTFVRALANDLGTRWKQPVIVLNKPGANEAIGTDFVVRSAADGYTLLAASESGLTIGPHLYKQPYKVKDDLSPIFRMIAFPNVVLVGKDFPASNMQEFLAYAKKQEATKPITYGSTGVGSLAHLFFAQFENASGVKMHHVPFKGASDQIPALISGFVDTGVLTVSAAEGYANSGQLKAIALTAPSRNAKMPNLPTTAETGLKDTYVLSTLMLLAPKGTLQTVVDAIAEATRATIASAEFKAKNIDSFGNIAYPDSSPADVRAYIARDMETQGARIQNFGIKVE